MQGNLNEISKVQEGTVFGGINLTIPQGCIYGLLGRNGVGKTTIIRILLGLDFPTRGKTHILGCHSRKLTPKIKGQIGYVAEGHNLIQNYSVEKLMSICKKLSPTWNDDFLNHLIQTFRLPLNRKVRQLSTGMRAQLNLVLAMTTDPQLLILDDPTLGLDTVVRRQFLELAIDLLTQDNRTILFSSHILSDVERIADRIGILSNGKLVVDCPLEELKNRVKKLRLVFPNEAPPCLPLAEIISQKTNARETTLTIANFNQQKQAVIDTFKPSSCTEIPMSLEDIFIECTKTGQVVNTGE